MRRFRLLGLELYNFGCFAGQSKMRFKGESNAMFLFGQPSSGKTAVAKAFEILQTAVDRPGMNSEFLASWGKIEQVTTLKVMFQAEGQRTDWSYSYEIGLNKVGIVFEELKVQKSWLSPKKRTVFSRTSFAGKVAVQCDAEYDYAIKGVTVPTMERSFLNACLFGDEPAEHLLEILDAYKFLQRLEVIKEPSNEAYLTSCGGFVDKAIKELWGLNRDLESVFPMFYSKRGNAVSWEELSGTERKIYTILSEVSKVFDKGLIPIIDISLKGLTYDEGRKLLDILVNNTCGKDFLLITDHSPAFNAFKGGQVCYIIPEDYHKENSKFSTKGKTYFGKTI